MTNHHTDLLAEIAAFCASRGMSKTAFGKQAVSDPNLVSQVERGERQLLPKTVEKIRAFMAGQGVPQ